jgi:hypothetical protein
LGNGILKYAKENKRMLIIAGFALLGILLVLLSGSIGGKESESIETAEQTLDEYKESLEGKIETLCSDVSGVGKCRVFITFERGVQNSYKGSTVTETKPPKVLGVTVICKGGEIDSVKKAISDMICALFDIGYNRVAVLQLNS